MLGPRQVKSKIALSNISDHSVMLSINDFSPFYSLLSSGHINITFPIFDCVLYVKEISEGHSSF